MASIQDEIFKSFAAVAGQPTSNTGGMLNPLADLVAQIGKMQAGGTAQVQTQARAQAAAGKSTASMVGSIASTVLKTGFGMAPLVGELLGLFGGGGSPAPAPLVKYAMPAAIHFEGAETAGGLSSGDYDQRGMARAYGAEAAGGGGTASTGAAQSSGGNAAGGQSAGGSAAPQITVHVQAMDARSFLDRSSDIAAAVRDAMLNMNAINDVVSDL